MFFELAALPRTDLILVDELDPRRIECVFPRPPGEGRAQLREPFWVAGNVPGQGSGACGVAPRVHVDRRDARTLRGENGIDLGVPRRDEASTDVVEGLGYRRRPPVRGGLPLQGKCVPF